MPIVVIGLSHHSSPVNVRERFAFAEARIPAALQSLRDSGAAQEAVILSTCNRVEIYAATSLEPRAAFAELQEFLFASTITAIRSPTKFTRSPNRTAFITCSRSPAASIRWCSAKRKFSASSKRPTTSRCNTSTPAARLNKAFQRAFNVAKHIRTETNIQRGSVSVGSVAVELAEKIFTSLDERHVMVIGAGDTSEKTARALLSRGAHSIIVANRSLERAARARRGTRRTRRALRRLGEGVRAD